MVCLSCLVIPVADDGGLDVVVVVTEHLESQMLEACHGVHRLLLDHVLAVGAVACGVVADHDAEVGVLSGNRVAGARHRYHRLAVEVGVESASAVSRQLGKLIEDQSLAILVGIQHRAVLPTRCRLGIDAADQIRQDHVVATANMDRVPAHDLAQLTEPVGLAASGRAE